MLSLKGDVNPKDYETGVIVARFQGNYLHEGQMKLIGLVKDNHKQVIIFLGVPIIEGTKNNPLSFEVRKVMVEAIFSNITILPLKDQRSNELWSETVDSMIADTFQGSSALLYGSRDSFIPYYSGKHQTVEVITDVIYSGTELRNKVSKEILDNEYYRAGIIYATHAKRDVTYPTVDVAAINADGHILLAKKANEGKLRFVGGFVDRADCSYEEAAKREFNEETGGEIINLKYIASQKIDDWRYAKEADGIMTTLYLGEFVGGTIEPNDDIVYLHWVNPTEIDVENDIMEEHKTLMVKLLTTLNIK